MIKQALLRISVPAKYTRQFDLYMLQHTLSRLTIFVWVTFIVNLLAYFIPLLTQDTPAFDGTAGESRLLYISVLSFMGISILFLVLTRIFSKRTGYIVQWFLCYLLVVSFAFDALVRIFITASNFDQLFFFASTLFLMLFVPEFKRKVYAIPTILFYVATALILRYHHSEPLLGKVQMVFFMTFVGISTIKVMSYNNRISVFIQNLHTRELNNHLLQANEQLESLSGTDELTKLNNRRSFLHYYDIIWKQGMELQLPIHILMIDVDFFKKYNDALGHLAGDKALIAIAGCIQCRKEKETNFSARFGGEEFVYLLPYMEKDAAEDFAKKIICCVEDLKITHPCNDCSPYLTISAGLAGVIPSETYTKEQLLDDADKALYRAKLAGRNRVSR
jgi:diguanylate cyclase (GGDEF)-like protein